MSAHRDLKLDKYEISKFAYRELFNFCRQYPEKKEKLKAIRRISAAPIISMPSGNSVGNPTEKKAIRAASIASDCELIETTVMEAGADVYSWLLKSVTEENASWEKLDPPIGINQFYERRRRFFFLLAYKKGMV